MEIRILSNAEFKLIFDQHMLSLFPESLWYDVREVLTPEERSGFQDRVARTANRHEVHLAAFEGEDLVGWTTAFQTKPLELYMRNSAVFPQYRRKGVYTKLMNEMLVQAEKAGYQTVSSYHICTNNAVIIPKLKAGFNIVGMEVWDDVGVVVRLVRNLNDLRQDVLEFRSGEAHPSRPVRDVLKL